MKVALSSIWILSAACCTAALSQQTSISPASESRPVSAVSAEGTTTDPTPAMQRIEIAKRQIAADPTKVHAFNDLAIGYLKRARETGNSRYLPDAQKALKQGLALDAKDFQLQLTQTALLLAMHRYAQADEKARALNKRTPDDVMTYGYMAEAEIALGKYADAESNAQWMLNMRPNNIPGLVLGARLRALYGDPTGALQFLNLAYAETAPNELEEQAWIANQIAGIDIDTGKSEAAESILAGSRQSFPNYPSTLRNLARIRMTQNRAAEAAQLLLQASTIGDDPDTLYRLAQAQFSAGKSADAQATQAEFARLTAENANLNSNQDSNQAANLSDEAVCDRILLYASEPDSAPKALALATSLLASRQDVWSLDAGAWALYANGKYSEADSAIQKAIGVGIQSAQIFDHAGHIAQKLNRDTDAAREFELALRTDPASEYALDARKAAGSIQSAAVESPANVPAKSTPASGDGAQQAQPMRQSAQVELAGIDTASAFAPVPADLLVPRPTETDRMIRKVQGKVAADPTNAESYAELGAAHFQRARETGDVADYQVAEDSLNKSLDIVSADFSAGEALGTMAEVCMGEHRFEDALSYSHKALSLGTGDVSPFAIVGDAYADMGEYDKARAAYARLTPPEMTLSPRAAYARDSRLAYLKFIAGDTPGAIGLMKISVSEGVEAQLPSENLAWLYYELGEFYVQAGQAALGDSAYMAALKAHPGDYRALAAMARLRANQGKSAEAIVLYRKAIAVVPMPIFVAELGDLYEKSGNRVEAQKQYQLVEYIGLLGHINQVLHNRDLALFYADHDLKLDEALQLAQKELEVRHDVYTWDALAWALYKNGKYAEASRASEKALHYGTRDALLLYHAGVISERMGQLDQARSELKEALKINPHFHLNYADAAQQKLSLLETQAATHTVTENHVD